MSHGPGPSDLEREIIQLCGLSKMLAPGLLRRALADVNAANPPTPDDVLRALPMIETRMRAYLPPPEVRERSFQMRRLLESWGSPPANAVASASTSASTSTSASASKSASASGRPSRPPLAGRG